MDSNMTTNFVEYPDGQAPDLLLPKHDKSTRFLIGKAGERPLVALSLTPAPLVGKIISNETTNSIIKTSKKLGNDGWVSFHLYPEVMENVEALKFDQSISDKNVRQIERFILRNKIHEVWGIWGDFQSDAIEKGKAAILEMLQKHGVKIFYFGTLTKDQNPRHPLQKEEYWHMFNPNKMFL